MSEDDPFAPAPKRQPAFDTLSIADLEAAILALRAEIARCEAAIAAKKSHMAAADTVFGRQVGREVE